MQHLRDWLRDRGGLQYEERLNRPVALQAVGWAMPTKTWLPTKSAIASDNWRAMPTLLTTASRRSGGRLPLVRRPRVFPAAVNPPVLFRITANDPLQNMRVPLRDFRHAALARRELPRVDRVLHAHLEFERPAQAAHGADDHRCVVREREQRDRLMRRGGMTEKVDPAALRPGMLIGQHRQESPPRQIAR